MGVCQNATCVPAANRYFPAIGRSRSPNFDPGANNTSLDGTPVGMQDDVGLFGAAFSAIITR